MSIDNASRAALAAALVSARNALDGAAATLAAIPADVVTPPPPPPPPDPDPVPPPSGGLSAERRPFAPTFAFNIPVGANPQIDPRSDDIIGGGFPFTTDESRWLLTPYTAINEVSQNEQGKVYTVGGYSIRGPLTIRRGPSPDYATVIRDTALQVEMRLFQPDAAITKATGMGIFDYSAQSTGAPRLGDGTGCGLSSSAGTPRMADFDTGVIPHALRVHLNSAEFSNRFRAPARKTDQPKLAPTRNPSTAIDMGMRLQLDPTLKAADYALGLTGLAAKAHATIFTALQVYGLFFCDGTGTGIQLVVEAAPDIADHIGPANSGGSWSHIVRAGRIPWSKFRVIAPISA